jgi:hypothetical protein
MTKPRPPRFVPLSLDWISKRSSAGTVSELWYLSMLSREVRTVQGRATGPKKPSKSDYFHPEFLVGVVLNQMRWKRSPYTEDAVEGERELTNTLIFKLYKHYTF